MNYQLEKYKGRSTRHQCPQCSDPHSFTLYVDENGEPLSEICGRCDHESGCGYHYTPKQFFSDNPNLSGEKNFVPALPQMKQHKELCTIPFKVVKDFASYRSTFVLFLCGLFDRYTLENPTIERLGELYALGATDDESVIFWQIDINGRVRTGKIMKYGADGHRIKDGSGINWVHSKMKKQNQLPEDWELTQCLFGEHLLNWERNKRKVVALVESEKTALIGAACYPQYVWLATGGKSQLSIEKMKVLSGRTIVMFPDVDGFDYWKEKARTFTFAKFIVSDALAKNTTNEGRAAKIDIADLLIKELKGGYIPPKPPEEYDFINVPKPESDFERLVRLRPEIKSMIEELNLVPDD